MSREVASFRPWSRALLDSAPVVAPLGGDRWAVGWTDQGGDGDGRGVLLGRFVWRPDGPQLDSARYASQSGAGAQRDIDLLLHDGRLIATWVDDATLETGTDVRLRVFDSALRPLTPEQSLSGSRAGDSGFVLDESPALGELADGFGVAFRASAESGQETIEVLAFLGGGLPTTPVARWRLGPHAAGPSADAPAVVGMDDRHLLIVYTAGLPVGADHSTRVGRIHAAIVDTQDSEKEPVVLSVGAAQLPDSASQSQPVAAATPGGAIVAWRTDDLSGFEPLGSELWSVRLSLPSGFDAPAMKAGDLRPVPRRPSDQVGDQIGPALATVPAREELPWAHPGGTAIVWSDYSSRYPDRPRPHVVARVIPGSGLELPAQCAPESPCAEGEGLCEQDADCDEGALCEGSLCSPGAG